MSSRPTAVKHNMHACSVHVNRKIPEIQEANHVSYESVQAKVKTSLFMPSRHIEE